MIRARLVATLSERIAASHESGKPLGVMLVRLQRVREFHMIYGYTAGDALAVAAYALLQQVLRPDDLVVRVGEYEFVALLPDLHDTNHAALAGSRVVRAFQQPLSIGERSVPAAVAVGISVAPAHGVEPEDLLRHAELAYGAALRSGERSVLYSALYETSPIPYETLRDAINGNRFDVHLQPILDLAGNRIVGAESLARWTEPGRGVVAPDTFIPLAEKTGLISELTRWSVNATMRHAASARRTDPALGFSINLSPRVFAERDIVAQLTSALKIWDVPACSVTWEVTETALMEDPALSLRLLEQLRQEGFGISIDDFGSGYSSLAYLKEFPATELKIDRTFVTEMQCDVRSEQLVRSIVELGHDLRMSVVAEGVEDATTLDMLTRMGCDRAQGYHIRRPQPAVEFIASLADQATTAR